MLDWMFIVLLITAIIFMIFTFETKSLAIGGVCMILWFILGLGVLSIEIPYQMYNASSEMIETGTQEITSLHFLSPLFSLMGAIVAIFLFVSVIFPMLKQKFSKTM